MARLDGFAPNLHLMQRALVGTPRLITDEDLNDSDKIFIVPGSYQWRIQHIWVEFSSTSGGDRQLEVQIQDLAGDVMGAVRAGKEQGGSVTEKYMFAPGLNSLTSFYDGDWLPVGLPENWIILGGWGIRVFDNNAIDASNDDMIIQMLVMEMDTVTPRADHVPTRRREFGTEVPVEQLVLSFTAPKIGVYPVFIPGVEQLAITTTAPTVGPALDVPVTQLELSVTAPTTLQNTIRNPGAEQLDITSPAPAIAFGTPFAPGVEQLTLTFSAPAVGVFPVFFPGTMQLRIALATPAAIVNDAFLIPYTELAVTMTAPTIGVYPVIQPGAEQLTITPTAPTVVTP